MNYLVIKDNTITQICTSREDLLNYLEVNITDNGIIEVGNEKIELPTSYNMFYYTKQEIMKDLDLKKIECMLKIGIYKLERI